MTTPRKYDIIGVVESWATTQVYDAELTMEGYIMFRKDRCGQKGGGILLYIRDNLAARLDESCSQIEFDESIWCIVEVGKVSFVGGFMLSKAKQ
jgi:hypothetical protein